MMTSCLRFLILSILLLMNSCSPQGSTTESESEMSKDETQSQDSKDQKQKSAHRESTKKSKKKSKKDKREIAPTPVEVSVISRGSITSKLRTVSILEPKERATVRSLISGVVSELQVDEGDHVKAGQVLAKISRPGATSLLRQAASSYQKSLHDLKRIEGLVKKGLAPREELNQALFQKDQTALEVSRLRAEAKNETITSPIDGVVVSRSLYRGETVSPGQQMLEIMDLSEVYAPINLSDRWAHKVRVGLKATMFDRSGGVLVKEAVVIRVSPVINAETGTFKVWVSPYQPKRKKRQKSKKYQHLPKQNSPLPEPSLLKPGLFVTVEMTVDRHDDALLLPRDAVMYRDGVPFVAAVIDEHIKLTQIQVGFTEDQLIELLGPLPEESLVVSFGQRELEDGEHIQITKVIKNVQQTELNSSESSFEENSKNRVQESMKR